jgi:hypothetical protein
MATAARHVYASVVSCCRVAKGCLQ